MSLVLPLGEARRVPVSFEAADGSPSVAPLSLAFAAASGLVDLSYSSGVLTVTGKAVGADVVTVTGLAGQLDVSILAPAASVVFGDPLAD